MKDIPEYEGRYAITEDGRVWSYPKPLSGALEGYGETKGKWLKASNSRGYRVIRLGAQGSQKAIHRLVALTYLGNPPSGKNHINHKDGDKANNHWTNLEWCTQAENNRHAWGTGLCNPNKALTDEQVVSIREERDSHTQASLASKYGVGRTTIQRVLNHEGYA